MNEIISHIWLQNAPVLEYIYEKRKECVFSSCFLFLFFSLRCLFVFQYIKIFAYNYLGQQQFHIYHFYVLGALFKRQKSQNIISRIVSFTLATTIFSLFCVFVSASDGKRRGREKPCMFAFSLQ